MNNHMVSCILNHASVSKSRNSQITRSPGDHDPSSSDQREVAVKYPQFAPLYESMSFGRVAPEEKLGGFILSFSIFSAHGRPAAGAARNECCAAGEKIWRFRRHF